MKRRDFLRTLGGAGLAAAIPSFGIQQAMAAGGDTPPFDGELLFVFRAGGGMYQAAFCDPRERAVWGADATDTVAGEAGNLLYAPVAENAEFFQKYYQDMLVINGVKLGSNGHGGATYDQQSGSTSGNFPFLSALYAKIAGDGLPMPWLVPSASSRYSHGGVQPYTVLPQPSLINQLASGGRGIMADQDMDILAQFQNERTQALLAGDALPFAKSKAASLEYARNNRGLLQRLADHMPETIDSSDLQGDRSSAIGHIHRTLVAMQAGVTVCGAATTGGFDTHRLTEESTHGEFRRLTRHIDYLWTKAEELGIADRLVVHIASDVGRVIQGTNHWSVASTVVMGKNRNWTNRVVGMSGETLQQTNIDPVTLQPDESGVKLTTAHVQRAMRRILNIDEHELCQKHEFDVPEIDLLNPDHSSPLVSA